MSILEDTARCRLRIECPEIGLTKVGEAGLAFNGPGSIWTDDTGHIQFEIHLPGDAVKTYEMVALRQQFNAPEDPKDTDYFALRAVDSLGEVYSSSILYPEPADIPGVAKGGLTQLESTRQLSGSEESSTRMLVRKKLNFPEIEHFDGKTPRKDYSWIDFTNGEKIELFDKSDYTELLCYVQPGGISENRHWRMIEAIEFAFGQSIYPCAIEEREGTKLTIGLSSPIPGLKTEGQLVPPLELRGKIHHYPISDLARRFYQYVLSYKEGWQPLIAQGLWSMRQAADAQPDIRGLVFAIAAETLIRACFPQIVPIPKDFRLKVQELQQKLKKDTTLDSDVRDRAVKKLNSLTDLPNSTKIREFLRWHVRSTEHQEEIFNAWSDLRNSAAHGTKTLRDFEKTVRRIRITQDLCSVMVFSRIGYYNQREWNIQAKAYKNSWSIPALNHSNPQKPTLGSTILPSRSHWKQQKGILRKKVQIGAEPNQSIELTVRPKGQDSSLFQIEFRPQSLLPDDVASVEIAREYGSIKEAMDACDRIALRTMSHVTIKHFA